MSLSLHPLLDHGSLPKESKNFQGGTLKCHCPDHQVAVKIESKVAHNHLCGCSKCWKPAKARFSIVGVVPREKVSVIAHEDKLHVVDRHATIHRHACKRCGVYLYGRIETKDHPFYGLDFIHPEIFEEEGWMRPGFAGFVSSVLESGLAKANEMHTIRSELHKLNLETYDCLNSELMDLIAAWTAKKAGFDV